MEFFSLSIPNTCSIHCHPLFFTSVVTSSVFAFRRTCSLVTFTSQYFLKILFLCFVSLKHAPGLQAIQKNNNHIGFENEIVPPDVVQFSFSDLCKSCSDVLFCFTAVLTIATNTKSCPCLPKFSLQGTRLFCLLSFNLMTLVFTSNHSDDS